MSLPEHIFRKYDIRGIYPDDLNEEGSYCIGLGIGEVFTEMGYSNCAVGWDNRSSSKALRDSVTQGLVEKGINVKYLGVVPTPVVYFMTCEEDFDCGIQITASHNPEEYNGIKFVKNDAYKFSPEEMQEVFGHASAVVLREKVPSDGDRPIELEDALGKYMSYFINNFSFSTPFKVVLGCGNGACSTIAPLIFESLGCEVFSEDCFLNSDFPEGVANPEDSSFMKKLSSRVVKYGADMGIGFDSDGDRVGFVDRRGITVPIAEILALFSKEVLAKYPGGDVIYDVKFSSDIEPVIRGFGGNPIQVATGHPNIDPRIKEGAVLGVEYSQHIYFGRDYKGFDDGIYAAIRLLETLDRLNRPLDELVGFLPKRYSTSEIKVPCPETDKQGIMKSIASYVTANYKDVLALDGVKVRLSDNGWFLIRVSNTSPYLSVRMEGKTPEDLEMIRSNVLSILEQHSVLDLSVV